VVVGDVEVVPSSTRSATLAVDRARIASVRAVAEDFRVEVELDDEARGYSLSERLRAVGLDDDVRERLGKGVVVTRDGSRLFAYTATENAARAAELVVRELLADDGLTADVRVTRWHPVGEDWRDAAEPLPSTAADEEREYEARQAAEEREAEDEGTFDWQVVAEAGSRDTARKLERQLAGEGHAVKRRWRYVTVGAVTEERAEELAGRLKGELGDDAEVWVQAGLDDVAQGPFQFVGF
jgi:hypothetical protein